MTDDDRISRHLDGVTASDVASLRRLARAFDVEADVPELLGQELVSVVLIGAPILVDRLIRAVTDIRRGGQVIDQRPGAERAIYRDRGLHEDLILVIRPDGMEVRLRPGLDRYLSVAAEVLARTKEGMGTSEAELRQLEQGE